MRCTAITDPAADIDQQQCCNSAVAIVGISDPRVTLTGPVCDEHLADAHALVLGLRIGVPGVTYLAK